MNAKIWSALLIVLFMVIAIVLFFYLQTTPEKSITAKDSFSQKNQNLHIIRVAYVVCPPLFIVDSKNKVKSGIFYEVINIIASRLQSKVEWIEVDGFDKMIHGLNENRYDVGLWFNSDRANMKGYTLPLYFDAIFAYVKVNDTRFQNYQDTMKLSNYTISTMKNGLGSLIAKNNFPEAKTLELPENSSIEQLILPVITRKADIVFLADSPVRLYQNSNPNEIVRLNLGHPLLVFPYSLLVSKNNSQLRLELNAEIAGIVNDHEIDSIRTKYEKIPLYGQVD